MHMYSNLPFFVPLIFVSKYLVLTKFWMRIPYSGKFWIGANFRIFRMMPGRTKIKSTKSFTF